VLAKVVVVAGPSGSGKSRLCVRLEATLGLPTVRLDDFYKEGSDPTLPRLTVPSSPRSADREALVDWDHPASWDAALAVRTLERLCRRGAAEVPVYDIAQDRRVGSRTVHLRGAAWVVAEGLFAQEIIGACRERGILGDAVCVRNHRLLTFWRRLTRDLRERRKPPLVLLRRGWRLLRSEPAVVAHAQACGATPRTPSQAYARVRALVGPPRRGAVSP
jgi:uridine kinase